MARAAPFVWNQTTDGAALKDPSLLTGFWLDERESLQVGPSRNVGLCVRWVLKAEDLFLHLKARSVNIPSNLLDYGGRRIWPNLELSLQIHLQSLLIKDST